jgi:hypothetical protein
VPSIISSEIKEGRKARRGRRKKNVDDVTDEFTSSTDENEGDQAENEGGQVRMLTNRPFSFQYAIVLASFQEPLSS